MRKKIYLLLTVISFCIVIGCDREANSNKSYLLSAADHTIIETYINHHLADEDDEHVLSVHEVLGSNKGTGEIYVWIMVEGYTKNVHRIEKTSGLSQPVLLKVSDKNGRLEIIDHTTPRDGDHYPKDIKKMFPDFVIDKFGNIEENLRKELEEKFRDLE